MIPLIIILMWSLKSDIGWNKNSVNKYGILVKIEQKPFKNKQSWITNSANYPIINMIEILCNGTFSGKFSIVNKLHHRIINLLSFIVYSLYSKIQKLINNK